MLKYAISVLNAVFPKKRTLEEEEMEIPPSSTNAPPKEQTLIHRIKVNNLPVKELPNTKKFLAKLGYTRCKKAPEWDHAYITFDVKYVVVSEEDHRQRFNRSKNRKEEEEDKNDTRTPAEKLADQVTPLHKISYPDQLKQKERTGIKHLMNLKKTIAGLRDVSEKSRPEIAWAYEKGKLPCSVESIIPSPEINGYRTKCEFTIGRNLDNEPVTGFLLGLFRKGITSVLDPSECLHVSPITKRIAQAMTDYVRASEYDVYDRSEKVGVWRTIMTKTQRTGDIMVLVQFRGAEMTSEQIEAEKLKLKDYWESFKEKPEEERIVVTTLIVQLWDGDSNGIVHHADTTVLTGDGYVYEELLGCRFRISSSAFFQVNTPATELLYAKCAEWCKVDKSKKTTLLDLCCGTGTIGITMAKSVDRVVGIEMVPEAIVDAKANAERNNITNVSYYANKVEDRIDVVTGAVNEDVIAVLDPPSCDAKQAMANFISLCRPQSNRYKGLPFKPVNAVSIDLFPHSDHSELMVQFERVRPEEEEVEEVVTVIEEKEVVTVEEDVVVVEKVVEKEE
ncbi:S-adenosyl-L-methionine-dependent methyltransferase [Spinellus fusiger]|nr:S-adenosyl-L-methionine-dependent methyltransferase [Spinellus fusiger]